MGLTHALTAGNRRGFIAMVVAGVFALSGVGLIAYAATNQESAPQPPLSVVTSTPTAAPTTAGSARTAPATTMPPMSHGTTPAPTKTPKAVGPVMAASPPVALSIPAINVNSPGMLNLGLTAQGSLQVPPPGADYDKVAWYRNSPTPGELGPAILVGHIDSKAKGPSVFFELGALKPGDLVKVTRADKSVATFKVSAVKRFRKADFPTDLVYGNTDHAALRIITCGGPFDRDSGSYIDNTLVLASLIT